MARIAKEEELAEINKTYKPIKLKRVEKNKYWLPSNLLEQRAHYNIAFGVRSNGKTFGVQELGLKEYAEEGSQMAVIRRLDSDFQGKQGQQMFSALINNERGNLVEYYTKGRWNNITFYSRRWWLSKFDEKTRTNVMDVEPFAYAFALNTSEHDKSTSYPKVKLILFDEFISRQGYLNDEFIIFTNVLSTIKRLRTDVKIFMLGNTISKFCPYFKEMGLTHILQQPVGTIELYEYGDSGLKVAVEYVKPNESKNKKASDVYFAFDNPKLKMITEGAWEMDIYPHLPLKYKQNNIVFSYFINNQNMMLQCNIIEVDSQIFTYIHKKTSPIRNIIEDIVYTRESSPRFNIRNQGLVRPHDDIDRKLKWFFDNQKVFYQTNEIGEIVSNWLEYEKVGKAAG